MNFVTIDNFDKTKISVGNIYAATKPVAYQKVPILYAYEGGRQGSLVVRTPALYSFGGCVTKDLKTDEIVGYSMPFVLYNENEGKTDQEDKFLTMMEQITDVIRTKINGLEKKLKEGGKNVELILTHFVS